MLSSSTPALKAEVNFQSLVANIYAGVEFGIGSAGDEVKLLQIALNNTLPRDVPRLVEDGIFGDKTLKEVLNFQKNYNLDKDGIVGEKTIEVLREEGGIIISDTDLASLRTKSASRPPRLARTVASSSTTAPTAPSMTANDSLKNSDPQTFSYQIGSAADIFILVRGMINEISDNEADLKIDKLSTDSNIYSAEVEAALVKLGIEKGPFTGGKLELVRSIWSHYQGS
jgi:hypothetical protein